MYDLTERESILYLCKKYDFHFKKGLGQNFLLNSDVLMDITRAADADGQGILEIGPGFGTLTAVLAQSAQKVVSVELDSALLPVLNETLAGFQNVTIREGDILKVNLPELIKNEFAGMTVSVAANLPYYITTPILLNLLEQQLPIHRIVVMIQKEVAERMAASPGGKDYGALSIVTQYYSEPSLVAVVPKEEFYPAPKVDSVVIALDILKEPRVSVSDPKFFFRIVRAAFQQRRKTLVNALKNSGAIGEISKEELEQILESCGIDKNARGETLSIEQFAELAEKCAKK